MSFGGQSVALTANCLFDEINGAGTWDSNPVVTRYEFELLK